MDISTMEPEAVKDVAILTMLGAGCFAVLFGQAVVIVALEGARDDLIRFMRS